MKNQTKRSKHRTVGIAEFQRFATAIERLGAFCGEAKGIAADASGIVLTAMHKDQSAWGNGFGLQTMATLTEQRRALDLDFQSAALEFMGEKPWAGENAQAFFERISEAFFDDIKLGAMLTRNNITFIGAGS